jgi:hypothetical protein
LYITVSAIYVATCVALSFLLFRLATKNRLGPAHAGLLLILRQKPEAGGLKWTMTRFILLSGLALGILLALVIFHFALRIYDYQATVKNATVLVCSLGKNPLLTQQAEQDAEIYRRHFSRVTVLKAEKLTDLLSALESGNFNILHLVNNFDGNGRFVEGHSTHADVAPLLKLCRAKNLLFVYLAGDIPEKYQAAVYKSTDAPFLGRELNLVITTDRGTGFSLFLDRLLREIASGESLGSAWLKIRPQDTGPGAPQPTVDHGPKAVVVL